MIVYRSVAYVKLFVRYADLLLLTQSPQYGQCQYGDCKKENYGCYQQVGVDQGQVFEGDNPGNLTPQVESSNAVACLDKESEG